MRIYAYIHGGIYLYMYMKNHFTYIKHFYYETWRKKMYQYMCKTFLTRTIFKEILLKKEKVHCNQI